LANLKMQINYLDAIINSYRVQMNMPLYSQEVLLIKNLLSFSDPMAIFQILLKMRNPFTCEQNEPLRVREFRGVPVYKPLGIFL
jgi:hypothetical protein